MLAARRRAGSPESAFHEASRVVLASLLLTGAAAAIFTTAVVATSNAPPDLSELVINAVYRKEHTMLLLIAPAAICALACIIAWAAHLVLAVRTKGRISSHSLWQQAFRTECPPGHEPYVRVKLSNGTAYRGIVTSYTPDIETDGRELALGPPLHVTPPGGDETALPSQYQRILLSGQDIVTMSVGYNPAPSTTPTLGRKLRRPSKALPARLADAPALPETSQAASSRT